MKTNKQTIILNEDELKDLIIKALYHSQGLSGIFDVKFIISRHFSPSLGDYKYECDGATITVE